MEAVKGMVGYQRYPEYVGTRVEWLDEVPKSWSIQRLKFLGRTYAGLTDKRGDDFSKEPTEGFKPFIPFTNIYRNRVISPSEYQYVRVSDTEVQNEVKDGDLLFLMSSETLEDIGKCSLFKDSETQVYLNSFCKGFRPLSALISAEYLNYLLAAPAYRTYFSLVGRGFTRMNIKQEYVGDLSILLPSVPEQTRIAAFLDRKCAQIDTAIAQKERLITLLKERRQVLVQQAVTKGLNPKAEMKDSGVAWLGKVPAHWEVVRNATLFREKKDIGKGGLPVFSVSMHSGVSNEELSDEENIRGRIKIGDRDSYKHVVPGDVAYNMMRAWQGAIGNVSAEGLVSPSYVVATPTSNKLDSVYFEYQYRTDLFIQQMNQFSKGIADFRKRLYWEEFKRLITIVPPRSEQQAILEHLGSTTALFEQLSTSFAAQITKLKEYRTVLINAAVTGKIKVPEA